MAHDAPATDGAFCFPCRKESAMLVLSRGVDGVIWIGDSIRVTVVDIRGGSVRLGVEAPVSVNIAREEILEQAELDERRESFRKAQDGRGSD